MGLDGSPPEELVGDGANSVFLPDEVGGFLYRWFDKDLTARVLLTDGMAIVRGNDAARRLIARHPTLVVEEGRLSTIVDTQSRQIAAFVRDSGDAPRSLVVEANGGPDLLVRAQRLGVGDRVAFGVALRLLGQGADEAISDIAEDSSLTRTEDRILHALAAGQTAREIAKESNCSHETIRSHIRSIYRKTGVNSRVGLMRHLANYKV